MDWDAVDAATVRAQSDGEGWVAFTEAPPGAKSAPSVLWLTKLGYEATFHLFSAGETAWASLSRISLPSRSAITVRVVGESDQPVEGATVEHAGFRPIPDEGASPELIRAHWLFRRTSQTDSNGLTSIAPTSESQGLRASMADRVSPPWFGIDPKDSEVLLNLAPCFVASGRVSITNGQSDGTATFVRAQGASSTSSAWLGESRVRGDGSWGPQRIALADYDTFFFFLDGGGLLPQQRELGRPEVEQQVVVDFTTLRGIGLRVKVRELGSERPIAGALVAVLSLVESRWVQSDARTNEHGKATVNGCAVGTVDVRVIAPGYASYRHGEINIDESTEELVIELEKAATIKGRCVHHSEPVEEFEVIYWQGHPHEREAEYFQSRADGSFELAAVPLGEVHFVAIATGLPRSANVVVDIAAHDNPDILLDFGDGIVGRGQVIDAVTFEPIPSAKIQPWVMQGNEMSHAHGLPRDVDAQGRFVLSDLAPGLARLTAEAAGYAHKIFDGFAESGEELDFGFVSLARSSQLEVHLLANEPLDFGAYDVWLTGPEHHPKTRFDADGVARFASLAPSVWELEINGPAGEQFGTFFTVEAGKSARLDVAIDGDRDLVVELVPAAGEPLGDGHWIVASYVDRFGNSFARSLELPAGKSEVRFGALAANEVTITVFDHAGQHLAMAATRMSPGENRVRVELGVQRVELRIVDGARAPVSACEVIVQADDAAGWSSRLTTDEHGLAEFALPPFEHVRLHLYSADAGSRMNIPLDVPRHAREPIELELDPEGSIRVELRDGATSMRGVAVRLRDAAHKWVVGNYTSGETGKVEIGSIDTDHALLDVVHPGVWRQEFAVKSSRDADYVPLQVRRVGSVELEVRRAGGGFAIGVPVALRSQEFDADVGAWIEQGRVAAPAQGLTTDANGRLRIDGLPHGEYRWAIGAESVGTLDVPAASLAQVALTVD